jgi:hypothetical protein
MRRRKARKARTWPPLPNEACFEVRNTVAGEHEKQLSIVTPAREILMKISGTKAWTATFSIHNQSEEHMQRSTIMAGAAALLLSASTAFAAPCATGTTGKMEKSSKVDGASTTNVSPGAKAESPGTVGALNNVGSNTATSPNDVAKQTEGKPTAAQQGNDC